MGFASSNKAEIIDKIIKLRPPSSAPLFLFCLVSLIRSLVALVMSGLIDYFLQRCGRGPCDESHSLTEPRARRSPHADTQQPQTNERRSINMEPTSSIETHAKSMCQAAKIHYNVLQETGRGSMSRVYFISENKGLELCAVKIYKKTDLIASSLEWSIYTEVFVLKNFRHRNLLKILDTHEDDSFVYLKTRFCSQGTLNDRMRLTCFMSETRALEITKSLLVVLQFLHERGVAHRDIRPENILFNACGMLKLNNFGLAHIKKPEDDGLSQVYFGSRPYAAPEILSHKPYGPGAADLWSVGVVLYYMLTKQQLFSDSTGVVSFKYERGCQNDVHLEMLDVNILKRTKQCRDVLFGLLQINPEMRKSPLAVINMCDNAIQCIQATEKTMRREEKMKKQISYDYVPDVVDAARWIRCGGNRVVRALDEDRTTT